MIISLDSNGEWVKGAATGSTPYIAYHDQADTDVVSSGLLLGLSCAGQFEVETSHIVQASTYNEDTPLIAATAGDVGKINAGALATAGNDIIGFVTRKGAGTGGKHDVADVNSQFGTEASPNYTVFFRTQWLPSNVV